MFLLNAAKCTVHKYPSLCMRVNTSRRHADITVNAVRITAELLQAVDGALTYYRFPTKWSVINYLQHNGRGVHLLFREKLREKTIDHMEYFDMKQLTVSEYLVN